MTAASTAIFALLRPFVGESVAAILYMLAVVVSATRSGLRAAALTSILSFICWNFFFVPPAGAFFHRREKAVHHPPDLSDGIVADSGLQIDMQAGRAFLKKRKNLPRYICPYTRRTGWPASWTQFLMPKVSGSPRPVNGCSRRRPTMPR
ncbi:MAG: DUF4118 domain-containing protein [Armatimonadetes bacterium]|nr:DUF4118 domain-containing protein [Armatimonadota bacterium]